MIIEIKEKLESQKLSYNELMKTFLRNVYNSKRTRYAVFNGEEFTFWARDIEFKNKENSLKAALKKVGISRDEKVIDVFYRKDESITVEELLNYLKENDIPLTVELYIRDSEYGDCAVGHYIVCEDNKLTL